MKANIPKSMKAAVIEKFGGPGVLHVASVPVPELGAGEILVRVHTAGIGIWDPWLREGGMGGAFPMILGSDGAGTVVARGSAVRKFRVGDTVYGYVFDSPKGGFYAEYAAVAEKNAAPVPDNLSTAQAGALAASGLTALAGLEMLTAKGPRTPWTLIILGASGGVGHVALQLAKRMNARVLAVASGKDGVELVRRLGADQAVDGRGAGVAEAVERFAPDGLDAALVFANSAKLAAALKCVKKGGLIAYPNGVEPEPKGTAGVKVQAFDGIAGPGVFERLNALVSKGRFRVEISRAYGLEDAGQAHRDVLKHHLGKLALRIRG